MSDEPQLDDLLGLLAGEGQFHSRGEFTLDPGRNREKIASLLHEDSLGWLYWLVRCGVSLQAHSCEAQVGRNGLLAKLSLPSSQHLADFLDQDSDSGHISLHYLRSALLWAQAWLGIHRQFRASLVLEQPDLPHLGLALEADQVVRQQEESRGQSLSLTLAFVHKTAHPLMLAQRELMQRHLPEQVAYCPIPVLLDGRRLDGLTATGDSLPLYLRYYVQSRRVDCLGVPPPPPAHYYRLETEVPQVWPRPRFCLPPVRLHTFSLAGELPREAHWSPSQGLPVSEWRTEGESTRLFTHPLQLPQTEDRWLVRAFLQRQGVDNDHWTAVLHGVRLDLEPLDLGPSSRLGWLGVVGLDGAQTDLSGMRMVRDSLYHSVHQWLRAEVAQIHDQQVAGCH